MRSTWCALAVIVALVACSSSDEDAAPAPKTPAEAFTKQYCEVVAASCCSQSPETFYSESYCRTILDGKHTRSTDVFFADTGNRCIAALEAAKGSATFCADLGGADTSTLCQRAFRPAGSPETITPTKALDETCMTGADCLPDPAGTVFCIEPAKGARPTPFCQVTIEAKEGDACDGTGATSGISGSFIDRSYGSVTTARAYFCPYAEGLFCDAATKTCAKQRAPGESCTDSYACRSSEAFCDGQKCAAYLRLGDACAISSTTARCAPASFCDPTTLRCAPLSSTGGACTKSEECPGQGDRTGICEKGVCTLPPTRRDFCPFKGD